MKGEVLCDLDVSVGSDKTEAGCAGWGIPGGFDEGLHAKVREGSRGRAPYWS